MPLKAIGQPLPANKERVRLGERMTRDERMAVYKLLGEGYTKREVVDKINEARKTGETQARITTVEYLMTLPEAHRYVTAFRVEYLKTIKTIPIADKKVRLDDLEQIRTRIDYLMFNLRLDPRNDKSINRFMSMSKTLVDVLDCARAELEGPKGGINIGIVNNNEGELEGLSDEEIIRRQKELISQAQKIIDPRDEESDNDEQDYEGEDKSRPTEILLASPKELRRDQMPGLGTYRKDI